MSDFKEGDRVQFTTHCSEGWAGIKGRIHRVSGNKALVELETLPSNGFKCDVDNMLTWIYRINDTLELQDVTMNRNGANT